MTLEKTVTIIPAKKRRGNTAAKNEVKKLRVAAYCRVSTDTDEQATSYEAQVAHYTDYIQNNSTWLFAGIYADEGISGTGTKKREEFLRMIDDCMAGKIDMVVTKSISRFARNTIDCLKYIRQLKEKNIPVIFEKENINTMDAKGEVLITIMASLAQQESESLSKNVKLGLQYRYQQGKVQVNTNWFLGYTKDENGELVIDPEQAAVVRRIYREYLEGKSCKKIADGLQADGIPNGAGRTKWWDSNIKQILKNEKYIGDALLQKTITEDVLTKKRIENDGSVPQYYVENSHEAIISKELYNEVQAEINRRSLLRKNQGYRRGYNCKYALSSVLICGGCGAPLRRVVWSKNGNKVPVWRCRNRMEKKGNPCFIPVLHEDELHEAIVEAIRKAYGDDNSIIEEIWKNTTAILSDEVDQCNQRLKELQEELVRRVNSGENYEELSDEIRELKDQRDIALDQQDAQKNIEKHKKEVWEFLKQRAAGGPKYKDSLVRKMIGRIEVYRDRLIVTFKTGKELEVNY